LLLSIIAIGLSWVSNRPLAAQSIPHPTLPECDPNDPDLLLPDLVPDPPSFVREMYVGGRRKILFQTAVANIGSGPLTNIGAGPLLIEGRTISVPEGLITQGWQQILRRDGSLCARTTGRFEFHASHKHWHFERFVGYELRRDDPFTGPLVTMGAKASFCLLDLARIRGYDPSEFRRQLTNQTCDSADSVTGISVGWKDIYERILPEQNLDLDGRRPVPTGDYYLINTVDPDHLLWEKDRSNNISYLPVGVGLPPPSQPSFSTPTPRPVSPHLRPPRPRPTRRQPTATVTPTPTPSFTPVRRPGRRPTPTPRSAPPTRTPARRPTFTPTPTLTPRPMRPTRTPAGQPTRTPTMSGALPLAGCETACVDNLSQLRLTWYDGIGLDFSATITDESGCRQLQPAPGAQGSILMDNWLTERRTDTGLEHRASFTLADAGSGPTSTGGVVEFTPQTGSLGFTYSAPVAPIARDADGLDFPVVYDFCLRLGNDAVRGRMVCQPKSRGLLCHEG
jgi:hypothetical protein